MWWFNIAEGLMWQINRRKACCLWRTSLQNTITGQKTLAEGYLGKHTVLIKPRGSQSVHPMWTPSQACLITEGVICIGFGWFLRHQIDHLSISQEESSKKKKKKSQSMLHRFFCIPHGTILWLADLVYLLLEIVAGSLLSHISCATGTKSLSSVWPTSCLCARACLPSHILQKSEL